MLDKVFNAVSAVRHYPYGERAKRLIIDTPVEVAIGAVLLGSAMTFSGIAHERGKEGQIPLAFSEYRHMRLYHETIGGRTMPVMTNLYATANDSLMQVFEANNLAHNVWGMSHHSFAYELEKKVDTSMRIHMLITDHAQNMPRYSSAARLSIAPMTAAARDLQPAIRALDAAWDEDHDDVYRTEYYSEEECSGTGESRSCHMVQKSRQVYDHTVHTYTYDRQQGERAAALLRDFSARHPNIQVNQQVLMASTTNAENEWAIRESRRRMPGYKAPTQEEYQAYTNTWATGSNYVRLSPGIYDMHTRVRNITPQWSQAAPRARSTRYTTYSSSDSGPQSFQTAEAALSYALTMSNNVGRIDSGMAALGTGIPALQQKIVTYVNAVLHGGEGNPNQLRREILRDARDLYARNYDGGFDTTPANWGMVVLKAVMGLLLGAGLGFGADRLIDRYCAKRGIGHPRPSWQSHMKTPTYRRSF